MKKLISIIVPLAIAGVVLSGCASSSDEQNQKTHRHSEVYVSDGDYYTRTYDANNDVFIWWLLTNNQQQISASSSPSTNSAWRQSATPPSSPTSTGAAVKVNETGEPNAEEVESVTDAEAEGVLTSEDTTDAEAVVGEEAAEAADTADTDSGGSSDGSGSDGSDSGGDPGGSDSGGFDGGGDFSGGDFGGGGDGGGF